MEKDKEETTVHQCNYSDPHDVQAIGELINVYIKDEMGGGTPLTPEQTANLITMLKEHPKNIVLLAQTGTKYSGLLTAFENISTFTVTPMINIHDVIVLPGYRNKKIGRSLLRALFEVAKNRQCSRITLEVRKDNANARHLYESEGFGETDPPMSYWRKYLAEE